MEELVMYLKRKIDNVLDNWYKQDSKIPVLLVGIRQSGKTESVKEFAKRNKLKLVMLNFWINPELCSYFDGSLKIDELISRLSILFPNETFNPNETLLFFDEIQDCPRARLSFKFFKDDGRYNVIGSGSYLGINGYVIGNTAPTPVGCENVLSMKTMDFEEYLWALGYRDNQIDYLIDLFNKKERIPDYIHQLFKKLFLNYICIGGFPKVVKAYIETKLISKAYETLNSIIFDMKSDFGRRKDKNGKPVFNASEVARIQNVYDLIPTFLAKENKRFIVSKISGGLQYDKNDAIEYLVQAHVVSKVYNLEVPTLPLSAYKIDSQFKLFPEDIGLVMAMYGIETIRAINRGDLSQGQGAIYEAVVFDSLVKADITPFYFAKASGLEIDFIIAYDGFPYLVEAKAKSGNTKSSKTVMNNPTHYGKTKLIKIGDYNIGEEKDIITIPHYLVFVLGKNKYNF